MKEFKQVLIIAGGEMPSEYLIQKMINHNPFVICVNGGFANAVEANIKPDLVIGDLDSLDANQLKLLKKMQVEVNSFPPEKDKSDLELGLERAVMTGVKSINILGALGKRIDHTLFNIFLLTGESCKNLQVRILHEDCEIVLIDSELEIEDRKGATISLIPLTPVVTDISTRGLYYPLKNEQLIQGSSRGLSNKIIRKEAGIKYAGGRLLAVIIDERMALN